MHPKAEKGRLRDSEGKQKGGPRLTFLWYSVVVAGTIAGFYYFYTQPVGSETQAYIDAVLRPFRDLIRSALSTR
jgi:hypothetical protein